MCSREGRPVVAKPPLEYRQFRDDEEDGEEDGEAGRHGIKEPVVPANVHLGDENNGGGDARAEADDGQTTQDLEDDHSDPPEGGQVEEAEHLGGIIFR